jgi:alpha-glucosidase
LGRPALYARANAAIPLGPERSHTGEPADRLTLRVFTAPGAAVTRELYEDGGEGYGESSRRTVTVDGLRVSVSAASGAYTPPARTLELELRGVDAAAVHVDGAARELSVRDGAAIVALGEGASDVVVTPR